MRIVGVEKHSFQSAPIIGIFPVHNVISVSLQEANVLLNFRAPHRSQLSQRDPKQSSLPTLTMRHVGKRGRIFRLDECKAIPDEVGIRFLRVDIATGVSRDSVPSSSPIAELGRSGGLKGGAARAASMSRERRREIAKRAAQSRWAKNQT
jgi:hypothetical protein